MDGVLIDSGKWWHERQTGYLHAVVKNWSEDRLSQIIGKDIMDSYDEFKAKGEIKVSKEEFKKRHDIIADEVYDNLVQMMPGAIEVLEQLKKDGFKIALASSSPHAWISKVIKRFNLKPYFQEIISAEDIKGLSKPEPDIYLYTARQLGIDPEECLVIEDSYNGILSAKAAGMKVIGYDNERNMRLNQNYSDADVVTSEMLEVLNIVRE